MADMTPSPPLLLPYDGERARGADDHEHRVPNDELICAHESGASPMVVGHISLSYVARARWPRAALVALLVATMLPDLADFVLPQGNQCRTTCGMYTHAFPAVLVLAAAMATLSWAIWHRRVTSALAGALVVLHVVFDYATGYKAFWLGGPQTGLSLYRFGLADFVIESIMMTAGWLVLRGSPDAPRWAVHPVALALLIAVQGTFELWNAGTLGFK